MLRERQNVEELRYQLRHAVVSLNGCYATIQEQYAWQQRLEYAQHELSAGLEIFMREVERENEEFEVQLAVLTVGHTELMRRAEEQNIMNDIMAIENEDHL
ncbi:hypothetical protein ACN47E_001502 [Coniothyrium glycines]